MDAVRGTLRHMQAFQEVLEEEKAEPKVCAGCGATDGELPAGEVIWERGMSGQREWFYITDIDEHEQKIVTWWCDDTLSRPNCYELEYRRREEEATGCAVIPHFGGLTGQEAGRRGCRARERNKFIARQEEALRKVAVKLKIDDAPGRQELAKHASAALFAVIERVLNEEIQIKTPKDAENIARVMFDILRLESGQSTSIVEHSTREEKLAVVNELRAAAEARKTS